MKLKIFQIVSLLVLTVFACSEGNDYRDIYVGDYNGSGYSGSFSVVGTGASMDIGPGSGTISVSKDKSDIDRLKINIDDEFDNTTYSAHINGSSLSIDQVEFDLTDESTFYTYHIYKTGTGTITESNISLQFQYSGTAIYNPDPNDPTKIREYDIVGSGSCSGVK